MGSIHELLRHLSRSDVSELALGTGRAAAVKMSAGSYRAVNTKALTSADISSLLKECGAPAGEIGDKPVQWATQSTGVGTIGVVAVRRGDLLQARFTVTKADTTGASPVPSATAPATASAGASGATHTSGMRPPAPSSGFVGMTPTAFVQATPSAAPPPPEPAVAAASELSSLFTPEDRYESFEAMLERARETRASDLHVVAARPLQFRIAGELYPSGAPLPADAVAKLFAQIIPLRLAPTIEREGSCDFAYAHPTSGRYRVNVGRHRGGLKATLRVIPQEIPTLESLGLPVSIAGATHHHQGLIIITGPTGHGKTSTLAAIVDLINTHSSHHVITVEDPIEYVHPRKTAMMSQREVGTHTKSFQSALKGSLREDPDVIVVGELRDTETVRMALSAGETGHLLIATMNTPSAAKTIDRLIDLFPPADQGQVRMSLSSGLRMIVSQRLVPNAQRTGVVVAAELLPGSVALGNLIRDEKTFQIPSLQQRGKSMGIVRLDDSLAELVMQGKTTLEIACEFAESPEELKSVVNALRAPPPPPEPEKKASEKLAGRMNALMGRK